MKFGDLPKNVQERIRQDNPDVFRPMEARQSKPGTVSALAGGPSKQKQRHLVVGVRIGFVALLKRQMDSDNLVASIKPLRDAICKSLGIDDGDNRIIFEYGQLPTKGREGVVVRIEI